MAAKKPPSVMVRVRESDRDLIAAHAEARSMTFTEALTDLLRAARSPIPTQVDRAAVKTTPAPTTTMSTKPAAPAPPPAEPWMADRREVHPNFKRPKS